MVSLSAQTFTDELTYQGASLTTLLKVVQNTMDGMVGGCNLTALTMLFNYIIALFMSIRIFGMYLSAKEKVLKPCHNMRGSGVRKEGALVYQIP